MQRSYPTSTWFSFLLVALVIGCSHSPERRHPLYQEYARNIDTVLILPPEMEVLQQTANGMMIRRDDLIGEIRTDMLSALGQNLRAKGLGVREAGDELLQEEEIRDLQALFGAVHRSIQLYTRGPQRFPSKIETFEYRLGSVQDLLRRNGAQALVLTLGRKTISLNHVKTAIGIAVVEPQGRLIWYNTGAERETSEWVPSRPVIGLIDRVLGRFSGDPS